MDKEFLRIGDIEDFRKKSAKKGKCLICNSRFILLSPLQALEKARKKELFIQKGLISYDKNIPAFINYARDFEYEDWAIKQSSGGGT